MECSNCRDLSGFRIHTILCDEGRKHLCSACIVMDDTEFEKPNSYTDLREELRRKHRNFKENILKKASVKMDTIIKALKENLKKWIMLSDEEHCVFERASYKNMIFLNDSKGIWEDVGEHGARPGDIIFRLRPDYRDSVYMLCKFAVKMVDEDFYIEGYMFHCAFRPMNHIPDGYIFAGYLYEGRQMSGHRVMYAGNQIFIDQCELQATTTTPVQPSQVAFRKKSK